MPTQNIAIAIYRQTGTATPSGAQDPSFGGWARTDGGLVDFDGTYDNDGIANAETENLNKQALNRMARFMADDYLLLGGRVYKWNQVSDVWDTSLDLTQLASETGSSRNIGLYPVFVNNQPYLVTAWQSGNTSTWASARLNGVTDVWETGNLGTVFNASEVQGSILTEVQHRNRIYFISSSQTDIGVYDAILNRLTTYKWHNDVTVRHPMDLVVYSGVVYCLNKNTGGEILLHKIGAQTEQVVRLGEADSITAPSTSINFTGRNLLFVDNWFAPDQPRMYALTMRSDSPSITPPNGRWTLFGTVGSGNSIHDLGRFESKIPYDSFGTEDQVYRAFADHRNRWLGRTPGDPTAFDDVNTSHYNIGYKPNGNPFSAFSRAFWDGPTGGVMPGNTFGQQVTWAWAADKVSNGSRTVERIRGETEDARIMDIVLNSVSKDNSAPGKVRLNFDVIQGSGALNGTACGVRWFYDTAGHTPQKQCTLANPSQGSISGVHKMMAGIEVGGGPFTVDWDAKADNVPRFTHINLVGHVVTTGVL